MRLLLIFIFTFSSVLSVQGGGDPGNDIRYVWAESGLIFRAEGKSGAEKMGVIPYGTSVHLSGREGEQADVPILRALTLGPELKSEAWTMSDVYLEVEWEGKTGWVYGGYLVRFPVPDSKSASMDEWLAAIGGIPDTLMFNIRQTGFAGRQSVYQYGNGIVRTEAMGESWSSTTVVIPVATLNCGYLIAEEFYWMSRELEQYLNRGRELEPSVLTEVKQDYLRFDDEYSSLEIRRVGSIVVITSEGGC